MLRYFVFFYHVIHLKHWHLRRKVKAEKSQSLQSHRVGYSFIHQYMMIFALVLFPSLISKTGIPLFSVLLIDIVTAAEEDSDDMFKPPKMEDDDDEEDDEFSPFGGKSGLFSGGKGLFDDDDDEVIKLFCRLLCFT